jgi:putative oxidoreductase
MSKFLLARHQTMQFSATLRGFSDGAGPIKKSNQSKNPFTMVKKLLAPAPYSLDWAALLMRLVFCGLMAYNHGLMKISLFSESPESFPDPLGIGSHATYILAIFAEAVCAGLVLLGLFTRLALLPLLVTMAVAAFNVNWDNSLPEKELPLLYLSVYVAIWLLGPGRFSLDAFIFRKR